MFRLQQEGWEAQETQEEGIKLSCLPLESVSLNMALHQLRKFSVVARWGKTHSRAWREQE